MDRAARPAWSMRSMAWVPFALVALLMIPAAGGSLRLIGLAGGPHLVLENVPVTASPVPVAGHIVSAIPYTALGAFQVSPRFLRRWPA
jgi:hypothetical protein